METRQETIVVINSLGPKGHGPGMENEIIIRGVINSKDVQWKVRDWGIKHRRQIFQYRVVEDEK